MRKSVILLALIAILIFSTGSVARAAGDVEYTWTLAALGQGGWIGGPLYADGSAGGGGAYSEDNGEIVARLRAVSWTEDADENITVCISATIIKGPSDALPSIFCTPPSPVTDTPVKMMIFDELHLFRISEVGPEE